MTVRSAQEQLVRLLDAVISASALPPTQKAQLLLQLQRAAASFDPTSSTQRRIVCNALRAFEQFLGIFGGRGVPIGFATLWRADSARIRAVIGSGC